MSVRHEPGAATAAHVMAVRMSQGTLGCRVSLRWRIRYGQGFQSKYQYQCMQRYLSHKHIR